MSRESFDDTPQNNSMDNAENEALCEAFHTPSGEDVTTDNPDCPQHQGIQEDVRRECAQIALALTAFFDGEAGDVEALVARTHLEECARCIGLQSSWTQQRQMLRDITVPVPPGLLIRLLTAIRLLSAFPQLGARLGTEATRLEPKSAARRDMQLLSESLLVSGANPFAPRRQPSRRAPKIEAPRELPPLDPLTPLPPANLRDEILRRTVGSADAAKKGRTHSKANALSETCSFPITAPVIEGINEQAEAQIMALEPQVIRKPGALQAKLQSKLRFANYSTALVPALAAWLMLLSGQGGLWAPNTTEAPSSENVPALTTSSGKWNKVAAKQDIAKQDVATQSAATLDAEQVLEKDSPAPGEQAAATIVAKNHPAGTTGVSTAADAALHIEQAPKNALAQKQSGAVEVNQLSMMENLKESASATVAQAPMATVKALQVPVSRVVAPTTMQPSGKLSIRRALITAPSLSKSHSEAAVSLPKVTAVAHNGEAAEDESGLRTRRASWSAPVSSLPATRRVNWAVADTPVAAQPDGENIEADAETLEHINRLNDDRPEDVRHVLDEYRASLLANAEEELPSSDL